MSHSDLSETADWYQKWVLSGQKSPSKRHRKREIKFLDDLLRKKFENYFDCERWLTKASFQYC